MSKEINNLNNGLNDIYATKDEVEEFQTIVSEAYNDIGEALGYIGNEVIGPMQNDIDNLEIDINNINRKMGDPSNLQTTEKGNLVGAINELFQSANNGKQLIANAIGEPLSSDDTFSAMSNDINGLLSTFKTNMMNNGVTVESGDKFKELIEKIKGLTEGEGNKGIQYAEITQSFSVYKTSGVSAMGNSVSLTKDVLFDIDFEPTIIILDLPQLKGPGLNSDGRILLSLDAPKYTFSQPSYTMSVTLTELTSTNAILTFRGNALGASSQQSEVLCSGNIKIYAIGVGEEDTTLLDSLKSILAEEGVTTTEEDDMASLITKVEDEITEKNNEINSRVIPAGNAVAEDVVSGKTFINSTGQLVTGSYIKPPDTAVLYPGTVSLFNLSASNIRPRDYHDGDGDFTRPLKVTCSTSIPKSGWYKIDLTMYETKDFPVEYRIITYTYVNNASKVINLVGKTASKYNGYYCNFTRSFYLYLMAGLPLELQIQGHSVFTSSEYGRLSYTIKCDYTG